MAVSILIFALKFGLYNIHFEFIDFWMCIQRLTLSPCRWRVGKEKTFVLKIARAKARIKTNGPIIILRQLRSPEGCRVQGSGFRVQGSGFRIQGSGFRVQDSRFGAQGSGFRVQGSGFRVQGSGFRPFAALKGPGFEVDRGTSLIRNSPAP